MREYSWIVPFATLVAAIGCQGGEERHERRVRRPDQLARNEVALDLLELEAGDPLLASPERVPDS
jgi:hypothetical protein